MKKMFFLILLIVFASSIYAVGEGEGLASISPAIATSGVSKTFTLSYGSGVTMWASGKLCISIPTGSWSAMTFDQSAAGAISITSTNASGVTWITNGKTITITATTMSALTGRLILTYKNAIPGMSGELNYFYIKSDPSGGTAPTYIGSSPSVNLAGTPTVTKTITQTAVYSATITKTSTPVYSPTYTPTYTTTRTETTIYTNTKTTTATFTKTNTPVYSATSTRTNTPVVSVTATPPTFKTDTNGHVYNFPMFSNYALPQFVSPLIFTGQNITITPITGRSIIIEGMIIHRTYGNTIYMANSFDTIVRSFDSNAFGTIPLKIKFPVNENVYFKTNVTNSATDSPGEIWYREE